MSLLPEDVAPFLKNGYRGWVTAPEMPYRMIAAGIERHCQASALVSLVAFGHFPSYAAVVQIVFTVRKLGITSVTARFTSGHPVLKSCPQMTPPGESRGFHARMSAFTDS
jgi:hypothetical protein